MRGEKKIRRRENFLPLHENFFGQKGRDHPDHPAHPLEINGLDPAVARRRARFPVPALGSRMDRRGLSLSRYSGTCSSSCLAAASGVGKSPNRLAGRRNSAPANGSFSLVCPSPITSPYHFCQNFIYLFDQIVTGEPQVSVAVLVAADAEIFRLSAALVRPVVAATVREQFVDFDPRHDQPGHWRSPVAPVTPRAPARALAHRGAPLRSAVRRTVLRRASTVSHNEGLRYEDPRRIADSVRRTPRPTSSVCVHACGVRCASQHLAQLAIGEPALLGRIGHPLPRTKAAHRPHKAAQLVARRGERRAWGDRGGADRRRRA